MSNAVPRACWWLASVLLALLAGAGRAQLLPGDLVVSDAQTGAQALFRVDPASGERTILSGCLDVGCGSQVGSGLQLSNNQALAFEPGGSIVVTAGPATVLRVDPASGDRSVVSGCTNFGCPSIRGTGPDFTNPQGIAVEADGTLLVVDLPAVGAGRVLAVEPVSGDRTLRSGCDDATCAFPVGTGDFFGFPERIEIEADGDLLVSESTGGPVVRVDPVSGDRTQASGFAMGMGPGFVGPVGLAVRRNLDVLVTDIVLEALFRFDAASGDRSIVSGCVDLACSAVVGAGRGFDSAFGAAIGAGDEVVVVESVPPSLVLVDLASGDRTTFSGCDDAACTTVIGTGPGFRLPRGVATVPTPTVTLFSFETDAPGSPPGGFTAVGGNATVRAAGDFSSVPNAASDGGQLLFLSTGPGSNGVGPAGVDLTGNGEDENDVASLVLIFDREPLDPPDLAFDFDVLTSELGGFPDPFRIQLDGVDVRTGAVGAANGTYPAVTGFDGVSIVGPDASQFDDGRLGYETIRLPIEPGIHTLHFLVADEADAVVDTGLWIDGVRLVPEPMTSWSALAGAGLAAALARRRRQRISRSSCSTSDSRAR